MIGINKRVEILAFINGDCIAGIKAMIATQTQTHLAMFQQMLSSARTKHVPLWKRLHRLRHSMRYLLPHQSVKACSLCLVRLAQESSVCYTIVNLFLGKSTVLTGPASFLQYQPAVEVPEDEVFFFLESACKRKRC